LESYEVSLSEKSMIFIALGSSIMLGSHSLKRPPEEYPVGPITAKKATRLNVYLKMMPLQ